MEKLFKETLIEFILKLGWWPNKKDTGKAAHEYVQFKVIDGAKEKIFDHSKSVTQIAYQLGFKYPQHFIPLFIEG